MDTFEEPYWNLVQVLAWIYTGDRHMVRKASDHINDHGSRMQEMVMLDGRRELVETPSGSPDPIRLTLKAQFNGGSATRTLEDAESELLQALQEGRLCAMGLANGKGNLQEIPRIRWADLRFYQNPPHAAPGDRFRPDATKWYSLKFEREQVLSLWPDPLVAAHEAALREEAGKPDPYRTGAPGRPTLMHLIEQEFDHRCSRGEVLPTLTAESKALREWAEKGHPSAPLPTAKTIRNRLGHKYWANRPQMAQN